MIGENPGLSNIHLGLFNTSGAKYKGSGFSERYMIISSICLQSGFGTTNRMKSKWTWYFRTLQCHNHTALTGRCRRGRGLAFIHSASLTANNSKSTFKLFSFELQLIRVDKQQFILGPSCPEVMYLQLEDLFLLSTVNDSISFPIRSTIISRFYMEKRNIWISQTQSQSGQLPTHYDEDMRTYSPVLHLTKKIFAVL
jgi:hypothetical protein